MGNKNIFFTSAYGERIDFKRTAPFLLAKQKMRVSWQHRNSCPQYVCVCVHIMRAGAGNSRRRQNEGFVQARVCVHVCVCVCVCVCVVCVCGGWNMWLYRGRVLQELLSPTQTIAGKTSCPPCTRLCSAGLWMSTPVSPPPSRIAVALHIHCLTVLIAISLKYMFPILQQTNKKVWATQGGNTS